MTLHIKVPSKRQITIRYWWIGLALLLGLAACSSSATATPEIGGTPEAIAISPERFGDLSENFGHTQVFSGMNLSIYVPESRPCTPLVESLAESIAWMDQRNLVPDSDADDFEERVIAAVRGLPDHLARTGNVS